MSEEHYDGIERRKMPLSEEQIELIAEKAADKAVAKMTEQAYAAVGKGVLDKMLYVVGVGIVALSIWLMQKGWIKIG